MRAIGLIGTKDIIRIEEKWRAVWEEKHIYEANPDGRKKYFATYPYSYMNGLPHIGHAFTCLRVDFMSRYKRMRGYNVLFPFAFHCTGLPIVAAAARIRDGERKQMQIMEDMGIKGDDIGRFSDPIYWTEYFPRRWEDIMRAAGLSIDWRRKFITTSLNPSYDAFVKWQFTRLKEKNFVRKGSHPVIWCPKDNIPVGDHDRLSGEGETPTEYTLLKFRLEDGDMLVAATLRPETAYGQTNIWANPGTEYVAARHGDERWVLSREAVSKLREQGTELTEEKVMKGSDLIGRSAYSFTMQGDIPILPAGFADPSKGTGIVSSVPSDSPDDYAALLDLKRSARAGELSPGLAEVVLAIHPIEIIDTPGYGTLPAKRVVDKLRIKSQDEKEKLEQARQEIYREGFYKGRMVEGLRDVGGLTVEKAREKVKLSLLDQGHASIMFEPSGEVVCRCLTRCIVRVVENQWFLAYGDEEWKKLAHRAVSRMNFYPDFLNRQFDNVIDWLKDWACVHHTGLGTSLPWDDKWKIESLSDSTLYMAYYTISHRLAETGYMKHPPGGSFFDYVFLGKGDAARAAEENGIKMEELKGMRKEFTYWYPLDLRVSGKDLVGNHLTFALFNHTAIFSEELWPRAYGVNGWITISGSKMSKSAGNSLLLDAALEKYGADVTRLTEAYAGEGFDDPNWDEDFAETGWRRMAQMQETAMSLWSLEEAATDDVDRWFASTVGSLYRHYIECMEDMLFKSAVKTALIDMQNALKWYSRRKGGRLNGSMGRMFVRLQVLMMAPFTPHMCEEIWHQMGNEATVCLEELPDPESYEVSKDAMLREGYLEDVMSDVDEIVKVTGIAPRRIYIYTSGKWQKEMLALELSGGKNTEERRNITKGIPKASVERFFKKLATEKGQGKLPLRAEIAGSFDEKEFLVSSSGFLERELKAELLIQRADDPGIVDPAGRSINSFPGRPAIYVE